MTVEHYTQSKRLYILADNQGELHPTIVNSTTNSPFSLFISSETQRLTSHISDLKGKLSFGKEKTSGPRSRREIKDVRRSLEHQINHDQAVLDVLEGRSVQPLRVRKHKGQIASCDLGSFKTRQEGEFWKFAQVNIDDILEVTKAFPDGIRWLREGFSLRFLMVYGLTEEERVSARKEYNNNFSLKYGDEVSESQADVLAPLMGKISKMFTG